MRISDWSSDVCSSDLLVVVVRHDVFAIETVEKIRKAQRRGLSGHRNATNPTGVADRDFHRVVPYIGSDERPRELEVGLVRQVAVATESELDGNVTVPDESQAAVCPPSLAVCRHRDTPSMGRPSVRER